MYSRNFVDSHKSDALPVLPPPLRVPTRLDFFRWIRMMLKKQLSCEEKTFEIESGLCFAHTFHETAPDSAFVKALVWISPMGE